MKTAETYLFSHLLILFLSAQMKGDLDTAADRSRKTFDGLYPISGVNARASRPEIPTGRRGKLPTPLFNLSGRSFSQHTGPSNIGATRGVDANPLQSLPLPQAPIQSNGHSQMQSHSMVVQGGYFPSTSESPVTAFGSEHQLIDSLTIPQENIHTEGIAQIHELPAVPNESRWLNAYSHDGSAHNFNNNSPVWLP